jgi:hypothetical protein
LRAELTKSGESDYRMAATPRPRSTCGVVMISPIFHPQAVRFLEWMVRTSGVVALWRLMVKE